MTARCLNGKEIKLCCLLMGGLELIWSAVMYFDPQGRTAMLLDLYGLLGYYVLLQLFAGAALVAGALIPRRSLRHWGLWLTPMLCLPVFWLVLTHQLMSALTLSLPFMAGIALLTFFMDAKRKPRAGVDS